MDFRTRLSQRIGMDDIHELLRLIHDNDSRKQELYNLIFDSDDKITYQAAWILTHFSSLENQWLYDKQNELIDEVLICKHSGIRRLILSLLYHQPMANPPRIDFLDFCLQRMVSKQELPGVQSLCVKIAYELCLPIQELVQELRITLEMIGVETSPAKQAAKRNVLEAMLKGKSLQII